MSYRPSSSLRGMASHWSVAGTADWVGGGWVGWVGWVGGLDGWDFARLGRRAQWMDGLVGGWVGGLGGTYVCACLGQGEGHQCRPGLLGEG